PAFRQGDTLGEARKHWFRAKCFQQYRLFYRFSSEARIIVLAWVNDETTLRAYGSRTDAYATFRGMLDGGNPPDDFDALMQAAKAESARLEEALKAAPDRA
uniref:type II toxin-antitoxin system YhaV family toxin n=1 Tax=uncultured Thiohalocapsa sp. TaxID=768990 RepID=UPI0025F0C19E